MKYRREAEGILIESMITLWESRDKWEEGSNLHGLLLTIIKNKTFNYLAYLQVRLQAEEEIDSHNQRELDLRIPALEACEPDVVFDLEIQHIVQKVLRRIPNQNRQIFILSHYQNTPNKKIAEQLSISVKNVEFHITKALKILRTELKDYLVSILL